MSNYSALIEVASLALGGKSKETADQPREDLTQLDGQTYASRVMSMLSM